jgi:hypothetical protein
MDILSKTILSERSDRRRSREERVLTRHTAALKIDTKEGEISEDAQTMYNERFLLGGGRMDIV